MIEARCDLFVRGAFQRTFAQNFEGGKDRDRRLAAALKQGVSALVARLSATGAEGDRLASTEASGANANSKPTSETDYFLKFRK